MTIFPRIARPLAAIFTLLLAVNPPVLAQTALSDLPDNHWAQKPIQALRDKAVIQGYPDGTFKPDQPITRAEFATLITKTFGYRPGAPTGIKDITGHWALPAIKAVAAEKVMNPFSDGSFRPENRLNRGQLATMAARVLHLGVKEEQFSDSLPASFTDVPASHWAYRAIEIADKLELLPQSYQTNYRPEQAVTRAEAAWVVQALSRVAVSKGKISSVDPDTGLVNIQGANRRPLLSLLTPETILLRNNVIAPVESLLAGDEVTAVALPSGDVKFFKAFGKVTKNDLLSRLSSFTKGNLKPAQINSLLSGDWEAVKDDLKSELYDRMVALGLTPSEAESIMVQDWNYLDTLSKERLAQAISGYLGITQEFSQAILDRDLAKIKEYGRVELATAALSRLLGVGGSVADNS
jgi:hypothetical protein